MQEKEIREKLSRVVFEADAIKIDYNLGEDDLEETLSRLWDLKSIVGEAIDVVDEQL